VPISVEVCLYTNRFLYLYRNMQLICLIKCAVLDKSKPIHRYYKEVRQKEVLI